MDLATENARLVALIDALREENETLKAQLGHRVAIPVCLRLTPGEERVLARLYASTEASKDQLLDAVIGNRPDADAPEPKIVDVFVHKIRRKVSPWGIEIETLWGRGYTLPHASREVLQRLIEAERPSGVAA